jgi:hypothetical protein
MSKVNCIHWSSTDEKFIGKCAIEAPGPGVTKVSFGFCNSRCTSKTTTQLTIGAVAHGAVSLIQAAAQIIGVPVNQASKETIAERGAICGKCSYLKTFTGTSIHKCGHCGCVLAPKLSLKSECCPVNRWQSVK